MCLPSVLTLSTFIYRLGWLTGVIHLDLLAPYDVDSSYLVDV